MPLGQRLITEHSMIIWLILLNVLLFYRSIKRKNLHDYMLPKILHVTAYYFYYIRYSGTEMVHTEHLFNLHNQLMETKLGVDMESDLTNLKVDYHGTFSRVSRKYENIYHKINQYLSLGGIFSHQKLQPLLHIKMSETVGGGRGAVMDDMFRGIM